MKRPVAISLSPNTESDDIASAWRSLFTPWRWWLTSTFPKLERQIAESFVTDPLRQGDQIPEAVLTSSGRSAIYATLQALGVSDGDEVIVQAFTCLAVPAAVQWAGATPVFADVIDETYNLDPESVRARITPQTKALIVQNTFGIPADISALKKIADEHSLILIEDLAHSFGGRADGKALGLHGDVAILSFGRDKTISSVFGGAVVSQDETLIRKIRTQQEKLPLPSLWWSKQQLLHPILMSLIVPLYFVGGIGKAVLVASQRLRLLSYAVSPAEKQGRTPRLIKQRFAPALAPLLANQLEKLPKYTEHRRRVARRYLEAFPARRLPVGQTGTGGESAQRPLSRLSEMLDDAAWLRLPIRVADAPAALKKMRSKQILLGDWYGTPVTPCSLEQEDVSGYESGSCPMAEELARTTINLPTYPLLYERDVVQVVDTVKKVV